MLTQKLKKLLQKAFVHMKASSYRKQFSHTAFLIQILSKGSNST